MDWGAWGAGIGSIFKEGASIIIDREKTRNQVAVIESRARVTAEATRQKAENQKMLMYSLVGGIVIVMIVAIVLKKRG